jgi:hypothetical protein
MWHALPLTASHGAMLADASTKVYLESSRKAQQRFARLPIAIGMQIQGARPLNSAQEPGHLNFPFCKSLKNNYL